MDKLRAIQYLSRSVETGSFTAAARSLGVSAPAVAQLIGTLERSLGVVLLHRTTRGISLTADGARYHEATRGITADLRELEQRIGPRSAKPRGTLTVGIREAVGLNCVMPRITWFLERYPEVHDGYDRLAWATRRAEIGRQRQTVTARSSSSSKPTRNSTNPPSPSHSSR